MARPGGKTAGRVSVRVIPDATKFRNDLKLLLKRVEQSMSANLLVTADTRSADSSIRQFQKDWNGKQVQLGAGVTTAAAAAQLRLLSRPRVVPLIVQVSQASVKRAATVIASLSGARLAGDWVRNLSERLENLDRSLPKIALVSQSIAGLSALLLSAVGGAFTLGGGLLQVFGIAAALPGVLTGLAVGGTVLVLAVSDFKKIIGDLKPEFVELKSIVTENFWGVAERPIRDFIGSVLPGLRSGLGLTATAVGNWSSSVVASFQNALGGGVIDTLFGHLVQSIDIASTGTAGFAQALVTLGGVGASFLPRLAQWTADLSNRFNEFITRVASDGSLKQYIEDGITAGGQLFDLLRGIGSTFAGITRAAEAAGGGGLASAAAQFERIAEVVNGAAFQTVLTTIFVGAAAGAAGLATALGPIGDFMSAVAPTLSQILSSSGQVVGQLLGQIATALSNPVFTSGLGLFFSGIQTGLLAIGPHLPALAAALGSVASFAGLLASNLGPVLGSVLAALAPVLVQVLNAVAPLLPVLGGALIDAITVLAPLFSELVTVLLPPLVELFAALAPALLPLVEAVLPVMSALLPLVASLLSVLLPLLPPILGVLTPIVQLLAAVLTPLLPILVPLIELLAGAFTMVAEIITTVLQTAILLIVGLLTGDLSGAVQKIAGVWGESWQRMQDLFEGAWESIVDFGKGIINNLISVIQNGVNSFIDVLNGMRSAVANLTNGIAETFGIKGSISIDPIPHVKIPRLAVGADILPRVGGTLAVLGEGGQAESVVNRGGVNRMIAAINARLDAGTLASGGGDQNFNVYPPEGEDPRVTARAWAREFSRQGG